MAALAGIGASFTEASTAVNQASKWTLSIKNAQKDVTILPQSIAGQPRSPPLLTQPTQGQPIYMH
jgi:hypothetical protein